GAAAFLRNAPHSLPLPFAAKWGGENHPGAAAAPFGAVVDARRSAATASWDMTGRSGEAAASASPATSPFRTADTAALYGRKAGIMQASLAGDRNTSRLRVPQSRLTLSPGTIIHAALTTAVNTD